MNLKIDPERFDSKNQFYMYLRKSLLYLMQKSHFDFKEYVMFMNFFEMDLNQGILCLEVLKHIVNNVFWDTYNTTIKGLLPWLGTNQEETIRKYFSGHINAYTDCLNFVEERTNNIYDSDWNKLNEKFPGTIELRKLSR